MYRCSYTNSHTNWGGQGSLGNAYVESRSPFQPPTLKPQTPDPHNPPAHTPRPRPSSSHTTHLKSHNLITITGYMVFNGRVQAPVFESWLKRGVRKEAYHITKQEAWYIGPKRPTQTPRHLYTLARACL